MLTWQPSDKAEAQGRSELTDVGIAMGNIVFRPDFHSPPNVLVLGGLREEVRLMTVNQEKPFETYEIAQS